MKELFNAEWLAKSPEKTHTLVMAEDIFHEDIKYKTVNRDPPIMLIILPIMLCCTAQKFTYYA